MANTMTINGNVHVLQGNGLYRRLSVSDEDKAALKGQEPPKYFMAQDGRPYEAFEDVPDRIESMAAHGALVAECCRGEGDTLEEATMVKADRDIALPHLDGKGRRTWEPVAKGSWIDATGWDDVHGVPCAAEPQAGRSEPGPEGWDVRRMACSPGNARMMWANMPAGTALQDGKSCTEDASVPVAVLFNENSSAGECRILIDTDVLAGSGAVFYEGGDNVVFGMDDLSEKPLDGVEHRSAYRLQEMIELRDEVYAKEAKAAEQAGIEADGPGMSL